MKTFTPIKSTLIISDNCLDLLKNKKHKNNFTLSAYIEEELYSNKITINICDDNEECDGLDLWLDFDIYQCELLIQKLSILVNNRKKFMSKILNSLE